MFLPFSTPHASEAPQTLRWLFLDLNSYFASVEQQLNPALRGKPVAVVPVADTDSTCAIAASYEAKAYGIKTGTMIYEARQRCPALICVHARHDAYVEYHHRILEEIDRHIPVHTIHSIDEVACKLDRSERTHEAAIALAQRIKAGVRERVGEVIRCSIGLSTNRFLAKQATNLQKPDGLTILTPDMLPERLLHWKLSGLTGIGKNIERRLLEKGIGDIATLYQLAPKQMRAIWGSVEGERFWYKLHGHELPEWENERRSVGHSHVLAPELRPAPRARIVAQRLTLKAASRLRRMNHYAKRMLLSVRLEHGPRYAVEARFNPACDNLTLLHVLGELWEEVEKEMGNKKHRQEAVPSPEHVSSRSPVGRSGKQSDNHRQDSRLRGNDKTRSVGEHHTTSPSGRGRKVENISGEGPHPNPLPKGEGVWLNPIARIEDNTKIKKVAITLTYLTDQPHQQEDFFAGESRELALQIRLESLSAAMDNLNAKYGRDTVVIGFTPRQSRGFSGTKIAFDRIPDREEFYE